MRPSRRRVRHWVWGPIVLLVLTVPAFATAKPQSKSRGVKVTIDSASSEVVLEGQAPEAPPGAEGTDDAATGESAEVPLPLDDGRWDVMCSPPCGRRLPREALFRITGAGVTTSATFSLPKRRPSVTLDVEAGTARWYWSGAIAAIAGGTFIIGSVGPRLAIGASFTTVEKVMAGAGVVLVGVGVPLWWFNRTTVAIF